MATSRRAEAIGRGYLVRLRAARAETMRRLAHAYDRVDVDEIRASFDAFVPVAARTITAGQAAAQTITRGYIRGAGGFDPQPVPRLAGTSEAGSITEALIGIVPFILGAIAQGAPAEEAVGVTGAYFVDRLADNEITRVVDAEIDAQRERARGWEGIVSAPTDACVGNAGFHTFDEEIYRHPGCNCERQVVFA